jgi:hypothetical protein
MGCAIQVSCTSSTSPSIETRRGFEGRSLGQPPCVSPPPIIGPNAHPSRRLPNRRRCEPRHHCPMDRALSSVMPPPMPRGPSLLTADVDNAVGSDAHRAATPTLALGPGKPAGLHATGQTISLRNTKAFAEGASGGQRDDVLIHLVCARRRPNQYSECLIDL